MIVQKYWNFFGWIGTGKSARTNNEGEQTDWCERFANVSQEQLILPLTIFSDI
jgi:hypothetical protein